MLRFLPSIAILLLPFFFVWSPSGLAQAQTSQTVGMPVRRDAGELIDQTLTRVALESMPRQFEETKDWGTQQERWDGVKIWRDGWKLETKRRRKMVNHGTWNRYRATLTNPDQFSIHIRDFRQDANETLVFDIELSAALDIEARQAKWVKGVQLYSFSAEGSATIDLKLTMEMGVKMGLSNFPPDVILIPRAQSADLEISEFKIDRISKLGGEVAQQVTRTAKQKLDEKVDQKESRLVEKINKQLDRHRDDLRFSLAEVIQSKWAQPLNSALGNPPSNSR